MALPLFPLQLVLFPGAVLGLKVFEARYLDLISDCLRTQQPFGVICLKSGPSVGRSDKPLVLEQVGTFAHIDEVDAEEAGILRVRCRGGRRFRLAAPAQQQGNGLWVAPELVLIDDDENHLPAPAMLQTVSALAEAIRKLQTPDRVLFAQPYRLDDAGWVANRWCELLPMPLGAKQKLMALEDPVIRLSLVDGFLRDKKVVVD